jgi:hypothetical protein
LRGYRINLRRIDKSRTRGLLSKIQPACQRAPQKRATRQQRQQANRGGIHFHLTYPFFSGYAFGGSGLGVTHVGFAKPSFSNTSSAVCSAPSTHV